MLFSELNLAQPILAALTDEGYTTPTPIQAQAIPPVLEGRDLLGCAQTGTGKTAAFALPVIHRLCAAPIDKTRRGPLLPRALILSPTRELATQIGQSFQTYGRNTHLRGTVIFGGVGQFHQVKALQRGIDVLIATPGRLMDLMEQGHINLTNISTFILDEADRMLDMGFIQPIRRIASALPKERQTLLFSATMPKSIMHLADSLLKNPVKVAVTPVASAAPLIKQSVYMVGGSSKQSLLKHLLQSESIERALVFTRTKHGADRVTRHLNAAGISADAIHGNKGQNQRQRALDGFRNGRSRVLVATDVAARGIDVDGITHVFNFDLPHEPESYVHRIGRTGRAGAEGIAIAFCNNEERAMLREIEKLTGKRVPVITTPPVTAEPALAGESSFERDHDRPHPRPALQQKRPAPQPRHSEAPAARSSAPKHREPHAAPHHAARPASAPSHSKNPHGSRPQAGKTTGSATGSGAGGRSQHGHGSKPAPRKGMFAKSGTRRGPAR